MVYQMARTTDELDPVDQHELSSTSDSQTGILPEAEKFSLRTLLSPKNKEPSKISGLIVNVSSSLIAILIIVFCIVTVLGKEALARGELWALFVLISSAVLCSVVTVIIWQQPESKTKLSFKVPFLPALPILSIFVNVYLMMQLDQGTWIRFAVWMLIGTSVGVPGAGRLTSRSYCSGSACGQPFAPDDWGALLVGCGLIPPASVRRRTLPAVLEDRGRMVSVNSKVILTLTPEGHALSYFPGVQLQLSDGIRDAV
ncbi:high affinity cationic amino acid transporter 1-like [Pteropus vampyrus]|uniref:High affinity cationic amino acid transporter 1-like n=1 Tax=Pteropus vampyrus TaxID=132908 RepID=A0A6P3RNL8_PTEVA|nr:high affinity cationic amino acid transporter 1-like [Pteropus vampyrus]